MNVSACYAAYDDYWAPYGNAVIVAKNQSIQNQLNDTVLIYTKIAPRWDNWEKNSWAMSTGESVPNKYSIQPPTNNWYLGTEHYEVDYCLVQPPATTADRCRLEYSPGIMAVICILAFIKCSVMFSIWYTHKRQASGGSEEAALYILGDAIASFMRKPDPTTENMCLATKDDFRRKRNNKKRSPACAPSTEPRAWEHTSRFWGSAVSVGWWITLLSL
jgi:hypothetical protein